MASDLLTKPLGLKLCGERLHQFRAEAENFWGRGHSSDSGWGGDSALARVTLDIMRSQQDPKEEPVGNDGDKSKCSIAETSDFALRT